MNDTNNTNIINIINTYENSNNSLILTIIFISPCICYILCCCCYICLRYDIRIRINNKNSILDRINIELLNKTTKLFNIIKLEELQMIKECTICIDDYKIGNIVRQLKCSHTFHQDCIDKWLTECDYKCPVCRDDSNEHCHQEEDGTELNTGIQNETEQREDNVD